MKFKNVNWSSGHTQKKTKVQKFRVMTFFKIMDYFVSFTLIVSNACSSALRNPADGWGAAMVVGVFAQPCLLQLAFQELLHKSGCSFQTPVKLYPTAFPSIFFFDLFCKLLIQAWKKKKKSYMGLMSLIKRSNFLGLHSGFYDTHTLLGLAKL